VETWERFIFGVIPERFVYLHQSLSKKCSDITNAPEGRRFENTLMDSV
jgi:hypothetical protein